MRKIFILCLLLVFAFGINAFAATKARTLNLATNVEKAYAVADASSGDTAEVDSDGSLQVQEEAKSVVNLATGTDGTLIGSSCKVYGIVASGSNAGDYVYLYDANTATGTPKFRIRLDTDTFQTMIPGGVTFSTNIYADVNGGSTDLAVIYEDE